MSNDDADTSSVTAPITTGDHIDTTATADRSRRPGSAPGWLVWSMIVLASVVAIGASMNAWLNRQLLDTDNWVDASDQILEEPAVRAALSTYLVNELFSYVDVSAQLEDRLPDSLQVLAGPISQALREPAIEGVDRLLATPKVQAAWSEANRIAHAALVRILEDDTRDGVSTTDGKVTLQLGALVTELGTQLGLPTAVLDRIPDDAGTIVIADSEELDNAQQAVKVVKVMSVFLLVLVIVLYAAAVFIASDRRAALRNVGLAITISALALLLARKIGVGYITDSIENADSVKQAARSIALIGTGILNEIAWTAFAIGFLILVYALLVGPTKAAFATRPRSVADPGKSAHGVDPGTGDRRARDPHHAGDGRRVVDRSPDAARTPDRRCRTPARTGAQRAPRHLVVEGAGRGQGLVQRRPAVERRHAARHARHCRLRP